MSEGVHALVESTGSGSHGVGFVFLPGGTQGSPARVSKAPTAAPEESVLSIHAPLELSVITHSWLDSSKVTLGAETPDSKGEISLALSHRSPDFQMTVFLARGLRKVIRLEFPDPGQKQVFVSYMGSILDRYLQP